MESRVLTQRRHSVPNDESLQHIVSESSYHEWNKSLTRLHNDVEVIYSEQPRKEQILTEKTMRQDSSFEGRKDVLNQSSISKDTATKKLNTSSSLVNIEEVGMPEQEESLQ